ncbi:hypothetical protein ACX1C1_11145 [Paenibacillus sp. strain BS8-2]
MNSDNIKKVMEVTGITDTNDFKELVLSFADENGYYKITAIKDDDSSYSWTTIIGTGNSISSEKKAKVSNFSENFIMNDLAHNIIESNQESISEYYLTNIIFVEPQEAVQPRVLPLVALGIYGLITTAIEAAMVGSLAVGTVGLVSDVLNENRATSNIKLPS